MISQSNVIAACLFIAFIVFITMRGKLPAYLAALFGTNAASGGGSSPDAGATAAQAASDPLGAAAGAIRRGLGVSNGIGGNLASLLGI